MHVLSSPTSMVLIMAGAKSLTGALAVGSLVLLLLLQAAGSGSGSVSHPEERSCSEIILSWSESQYLALSSLPPNSALDRLTLRDLLFFLHIPRTGGRTLHQCFLKHLFASGERCPRSYDKLTFDRSQPGCRLISTHDDYSLLEHLSHEMTSIVTSIRQPVDRVLSSYEFSIEVAARSLRPFQRRPRPKPLEIQKKLDSSKRLQTPAILDTPKPLETPKGSEGQPQRMMSTLDIWPWKYLVPMMQEDLFRRRKARLGSSSAGAADLKVVMGRNVSLLAANDSYDAAALAMPLHEFIHHPMGNELVHNGATFQVAGLTNTSFSENAGMIRNCVMRYPQLGKRVLDVAKRRLDRMLYVGLTERQNDSAAFLVKVFGRQVSMELFLRSMISQKRYRSQRPSKMPKVQQNFKSVDDLKESDVIDELMASYGECVADVRKAQVNRRLISLETIAPVKFSWERRSVIPKHVLEEIARLNRLDIELYAHAEEIFSRQQDFLLQSDFPFYGMETQENLSSTFDVGEHLSNENEDKHDSYRSRLHAISVVIFSIPSITLIALMVVIYLVRRRQGTRVKET